MSWAEIKHALNSKLGESDMKALDELIDELASTLENINDAVATVDNNVNAVKTNTAASTTAAIGGTLSQKLEYIIDTLLGTVNATGGTTTAGGIMAKLNALLTSWTSTRAGYIDNIISYTVTNNTASKTGVLSAKLAYVISLLENTTYGLSALKTASGSSVVKSVQRGVISISDLTNTATISYVNTSKSIVVYVGSVHTVDGSRDSSAPKVWDATLELTNGTTVTAFRAYKMSTIQVPYQVIEFY